MAQESTRYEAILDALLRIVADDGLDRVSVREVAKAAEVSIGTVQHYFPSKDEMLVAAYHAIVARIRSRLQAVPLGPDVRRNLAAVLTQLLPLDAERLMETRVHLAFAARAATMPPFAAIQREVLAELHRALTEAFGAAWGDRVPRARCQLAAHAAMAAADGLALHAASSGDWLSRRRQTAVLDVTLDALVALA